MDSTIFISYSWDDLMHELKVMNFLNRVREDGYAATFDKELSADSSATNFMKMMHLAVQQHEWVIVILSKGYKAKADSFTGGAGKEYELLLSDIERNPRKYILASFNGRGDDVLPFALRDHDVHDLANDKEVERLYRKLNNEPEYSFAPIGNKKRSFKTATPEEVRDKLAEPLNKDRISIEVKADQQGSHLSGGQYNHIDYKLLVQLQDVSGATINDFGWELRLPKWLLQDYHLYEIDGNDVIIRGSNTTKFYAGAKVSLPTQSIRIRNHEANEVKQNEVKLSVNGDNFSSDYAKLLAALLRIRHPQYTYMDPVDFDEDYFVL